MNFRGIASFLGIILIIIGLSMLLPLFWSLYYGDSDWSVFLAASIVTSIAGCLAYRLNTAEGEFGHREALIVVSFSWLLASLFGSLPYLWSGALPSLADALFETMSGFTTTGASVFRDVEALPHGILFWRSLTHWLGGMGIVVLLVAIMSSVGGAGGLQMFKAESPGPRAEKLKPRISETAKVLWYTYCILTIIEIVLLKFLGMSLFDAMCHAFGTLATGGFSTKNLSVGNYQSSAIHWVITIFTFLSGANFALYYQAVHGKSLFSLWHSGEFRLYSYIVAGASLLITLDLLLNMNYAGVHQAVRDAAFQAVSMITTTGYATVDFDRWSSFSKSILVLLMFIGGCAGSTSGSVKVGRIMIIIKEGLLELRRAIHPKAVLTLKIDGKCVPEGIVMNTLQFYFIYIALATLGTIMMCFLGLDLVSSFTSVAATLGNVGPGLGLVGPTQNYSFISGAGKYLLTFFMMLGRLELYTVLVLFIPAFWRYGK